MKMLRFIKEYIKHPRNTGAIAASTSRLAKGMMNGIDFDNAKYIVEIGPGLGAFTKEISKRKNPDTLLLIIEINEVFYQILRDQYAHDSSIHVVNGSAEDIVMYMNELTIKEIDYCISGLPFASLPKDVSTTILNNVMKSLKIDGKFITFQYSLTKLAFIRKYFSEIAVERVWFNLPPAYVLFCGNEMSVH